MNDVVAGASVTGLTIGLVEVLKSTGLPGKYAPLASLIVAILLNVGYAAASNALTGDSFFLGIAFGLAASGLYSGVKAVKE